MARHSTARRIAEDVSGKIRTGVFPPGHHLREQTLAEDYGVSRGPVREALHHLAAEFWVTLETGKGARVVATTTDVAPDDILIGSRLGTVACRLAALRATEAEMHEIDRLARGIGDAAMHDDTTPEAFLRLTWGLGGYLLSVARSRTLEEMMRPIMRGGMARLAVHNVSTPARRRWVARRHLDIAVSIRHRDGDAVEAIHRQLTGASVRAAERAALHPGVWAEDDAEY